MATPKKTAKPKTATKTAKPKTAAKTATQSADPVEPLDAANDQKAPDAPALTLAKHAEDLAGNVRSLLEPLAKAKVSAADGERLDRPLGHGTAAEPFEDVQGVALAGHGAVPSRR